MHEGACIDKEVNLNHAYILVNWEPLRTLKYHENVFTILGAYTRHGERSDNT